MRRRWLLVHGLSLTPLAGFLSGCGKEADWPNGMAPIKWDRDACERCKMIISDKRFASQLRGGPKDTVFKFDDIGCAATWLAEKHKEYPWMTDASTHLWVADFAHPGKVWLAAQAAHYLSGKTSPMGYNYAAYADAQSGSISFDAMGQKTASTWPANCTPGSRVTASTASAVSN